MRSLITLVTTHKSIEWDSSTPRFFWPPYTKEASKLNSILFITGPSIHPAVYNRSREVEYVRCISAKILPFLVPMRFQTSRYINIDIPRNYSTTLNTALAFVTGLNEWKFLFRASFNLVVDILSGALLQPLLDLLADPDTINLFIDEGFSPEPSKTFDKRSGKDVEFLNNFVASHHSPSQSVSWKFLLGK